MVSVRKLRTPIAIGLLLGLTLRSLIASGLMLIDEGGLAGFSLALCPAQNSAIDFDILHDRNAGGHHHGHEAHTGDADPGGAESDQPVHAESFDPGCLAWLGSGENVLGFASDLDIRAFACLRRVHAVGCSLHPVQIFLPGGPRGPPQQQATLLS